jgi:cellulose synthase (UDP-forming)
LGSQAPLFYGPIQQGKDGWNAAFFCGSNAVIRREALMRLGVSRYVADLEQRVAKTLSSADSLIAKARKGLGADQANLDRALQLVATSVRDARSSVHQGQPLADVTHHFQSQVAAAARSLVLLDAESMRTDMASMAEKVEALDDETLDRLSRRDWSPLAAIETVQALISSIDVDREDEAQPIMPMSVISVTEDMATCMRLHASGWKSVYHDETLALGLAPEDLSTMLTQRLRWAQGTMQVMFRENPVLQRGLTAGQRLMYLATMWSYLSGFSTVVYVAAPVLFLGFGVLPVNALSSAFFLRLVPFLLVNQLLFYVIGRGRGSWRGQQYALALFPIWIRSVTSAIGNVFFGRSLAFAITPKTRPVAAGPPWHLLRPQLLVMVLLVGTSMVGIVRWYLGSATSLATVINLIWVVFDLCLFSIVVRAARYQGFKPEYIVHPAAEATVQPPRAGERK